MGRKIRHIMDGEVALPFRGSNAGILSYATPFQRKAGFIAFVVLLFLSAVYLYGVMSSVMHVAAREELSFEVKRLSSDVATLEAEYLTRTDGITESFARERGYVAIADRTFVERTQGITFNGSR